MRRRVRRALVALGVAIACAGAAVAADAPAPGWAHELPHELMSPFCPGRTLADCTSEQAGTLKAWLLVQEAAGRSREDVEAELLARYGDVILAKPRASGFGLAAWGLPIGAFLAGGAFVALYLRRQAREAHAEHRPAAPLPPELERLVDEELRR